MSDLTVQPVEQVETTSSRLSTDLVVVRTLTGRPDIAKYDRTTSAKPRVWRPQELRARWVGNAHGAGVVSGRGVYKLFSLKLYLRLVLKSGELSKDVSTEFDLDFNLYKYRPALVMGFTPEVPIPDYIRPLIPSMLPVDWMMDTDWDSAPLWLQDDLEALSSAG